MANIKNPPILTEDADYTEWKSDLGVWEVYTDLEKKRRGPAVYLSLSGRAREAVRGLTTTQLGGDNGVKLITDKLDAILEQDANTRVFLAFKKFYDYRRSSGTTIVDFLIRYEYLYQSLGTHNNALPEGVQAFFLLTAANVSEEMEKLARATCPAMTYNEMKKTIQKIFGDPGSAAEGTAAPSIKIEPSFLASESEEAYWTRYNSNRGRGRSRGTTNFSGRGRGRWNRRFPSNSSYNSSNSAGRGSGNAVGRDGKVLRCFKCGSDQHFANACKAEEEVHFTLLSSRSDKPDVPLSALLQETLGMAILDSGCSKTVAGKTWMDSYLDQLSDKDRSVVKMFPCNTRFRFGDGAESISNSLVNFPAVIGNTKVSIEANVVENEVPLLLSRKSMKVAGCNLDFKNDTVEMLNGQVIKLISSKAGHYCIPLTKFLIHSDVKTAIVLHSTALEDLSVEQKKQKALKLHRQFSHASKEKLHKLVKESKSFNDSEFLDMISKCCDECELCQKFKRPPLRPVVGLPLADDFNQVVCMDLKEHVHNKSWLLHLIDAKTRYSAAVIITSKHQDVIIENIFLMWIAYFGTPNSFLSDNGGEFSNDSFREMNEKLNIKTTTTAGESPFSSGMVERHHLVVYSSMIKTMLDTKCSAKVALAWALSSKNSLQNHAGYSPNQLVFGRNPNMPSVLTDKLPALYQSDKDLIRMHLNAAHSSREAFVKTESDERIRRALRHNVRTYADVRYSTGDKVYYRRKNFKGWKGPAVVLGQDGQSVTVRHGGAYYRCHPCQLMMVKDSNVQKTVNNSEAVVPDQSVVPDQEVNDSENDDSDENRHEDVPGDENRHEDVPVDTPVEPEQRVIVAQEPNEVAKLLKDRPGRGMKVRYKLENETGWTHAEVARRQPKQTGGYKHWVNVRNNGAEKGVCINWEHVTDWSEVSTDDADVEVETDEASTTEEEVEEVEVVEVLLSNVDESLTEVIEAKKKELNNLERNKVFQVVPYDNQNMVSSKWVLTEKVKEGNKFIKARLVARGFQEDSSDLIKDSPTCSRESQRLVYLTSVIQSWQLQTIDITSAFLQGFPLEREVFLQPPEDVCTPDFCWKLHRCIYGLNDAPRKWYNKVHDVMLKLGGKVSVYDNALFLWHDGDNNLLGLLACHVDDFMFAGSDWFLSEVIGNVKKIFQVSSHQLSSFKFLGVNVNQTSQGITVDQNQYIPSIDPIKIVPNRSSMNNVELSHDEKSELKRLSGQMLWVSSQTRPDLSYETCVMSNMGKHPTVMKVHEANKALAKLKSKNVCIKFPHLGDPRKLSVLSYSDATYASLADGSSQGGVITFVEGINGKIAPICWSSKKLNRVTKSPLASETLALNEGADSGFFVASLLQEIFRTPSLPVVKCVTDNSSLTETLKTSNLVSDKRLRVDIARLREMVREEEITVEWVPGKLQVADALTKRGVSSDQLLRVLDEATVGLR